MGFRVTKSLLWGGNLATGWDRKLHRSCGVCELGYSLPDKVRPSRGCFHNERQPVSSTCAAIWAAPACLSRISSIQLWWATRVHSPSHTLWNLQWASTRLSANTSPRCVKSPTFFRGTSNLNSTGFLWPGYIWPVWPRRCTEWA
uniref:SEC24-like protein C, COPII coat complex component n=1 Tax=Molossus molossus TaxID=27622 RepID=A0A7J8DR31_MOLMO|nr:SEC24-like protein C, COPII coat complex component [Molossus molossus]